MDNQGRSFLIIIDMDKRYLDILDKYGYFTLTISIKGNTEQHSARIYQERGYYYIKPLIPENAQLISDTDIIIYSGNTIIGRGYINNSFLYH